MTHKLKGSVGIPLVATNRINTPEIAEQVLAQGHADMVSMARPFLADPFLVQKAKVRVRVRLRVRVRVGHPYLQHTKVKELSSVILIREDVIEAWLGLGLGLR